MRKMDRTNITFTGTRYHVSDAPADARISYRPTEPAGSIYRLPMVQPATEEERRQLRRGRRA